ncbi:MAG: ABC transporter permease [Firmicutes bacterium]|nr:ABC transporter permease [Bacillota bacterium]
MNNNFDNVDVFLDKGADVIFFHATHITFDATLNNNDIALNHLSGQAIFFNGNIPTNSFFNNSDIIISGRLWQVQDNNTNSIWISKFASEELKLAVGDTVFFAFSDYLFYVIGIFENDYDNGQIFQYDFVLSYCTALKIYEKSDLFGGFAELYVFDVFSILALANNLDNLGINFREGFFTNVLEMMDALNTMIVTLIIILIIIFLVGLFATYNFIAIILNTRKKTLGLYKTLGIKNKSILKIIIVVFSIIIFFAVAIGFVVSIPINVLLASQINILSDFPISISLVWFAPIILLFINLVILGLSSLGFIKHIKKINLVNILSAED